MVCPEVEYSVPSRVEKAPFDLDLFEKRYREELRDNTTGKPEDNDRTFYRWKEAILENRAAKR